MVVVAPEVELADAAELSDAALLSVEGADVAPADAKDAELSVTLQPTDALVDPEVELVVLVGVMPQYSSSFSAEYCSPQRL